MSIMDWQFLVLLAPTLGLVVWGAWDAVKKQQE